MPIQINEIREWGRLNGWTVSDEGKLPAGLRAAYDARDTAEAVLPDGPVIAPEGETEFPQEKTPIITKANPVDRARELVGRARKASPRKATGRTAAKKPRVSVDRLVSGIWSGLSRLTANVNLPVARVLNAQAPVAGMLLEDVIKNTVVDRALQPFARASQGGELAFALIAPPLLVGALTSERGQTPEGQAVLMPLLQASLKSWIDVAGPKLEEHTEREREFKEKYGATIDALIAGFFAPVNGEPFQPEPQPTTVNNGAGAKWES